MHLMLCREMEVMRFMIRQLLFSKPTMMKMIMKKLHKPSPQVSREDFKSELYLEFNLFLL